MESVPSFISEYESNLYLSITKKQEARLTDVLFIVQKGLNANTWIVLIMY